MALSKKFSIIFAIIFLSAVFCGTQTQALDLGLKAGISSSNQSYDYGQVNFTLDRLRQNGLAAGVFFEQNIGPIASFRLEVDYIQKGSALEAALTSPLGPMVMGTLRFEDRIDYLSFNLLATPSILNLQLISPYLIVGPRMDLLLSSDTQIEKLITNDLESTVYGASLGVGAKVSAVAASLFVEAVYQPDFTDSFKIQTLTIRNNSFLITAGLMF